MPAPRPAPELTPELVRALVAEAARKSRVCWLSYEHAGGAERDRLVWHAWYDDALVVLVGDAGQQLEGAEEADLVTVTMRSKDTGGRLLAWAGRAEVVDPADDSWESNAAALLGVRLNLTNPAEATRRWRERCTVLRIAPAADSGVAPPDGQGGPLP